MSRRTDIEKVREYEKKIKDIVEALPEFFSRLRGVLTDAMISVFTSFDPALTRIESILRGSIDLRFSPVILADVITKETVRTKREELKQLEGEVIELFKRLEKVLKWTALVDLCAGEGRVFVGPYNSSILLNIYVDFFLVASSSTLED